MVERIAVDQFRREGGAFVLGVTGLPADAAPLLALRRCWFGRLGDVRRRWLDEVEESFSPRCSETSDVASTQPPSCANFACSAAVAASGLISSPAQWVELFLAVGDKLGIVVDAEKKKAEERRARPGIASLVEELIETRHVPNATYRLQFNSGFTFPAARAIVPYLRDLGISDIYASPILQARPGSMHGYDICDHSRVSDELLGEAALLELAQALESEEMGIVLDVVPNHMAVCNVSNPWWEDVLEHGASSRYSDYFDIDWDPTNPDLAGKVLLPILGDQYGRTLESGQLRLSYSGGSFVINYFETALPVAPGTYVLILSPQISDLKLRLGDDHEHLLEYRSILTAIEHLPPGPDSRSKAGPSVIARSRSSSGGSPPWKRRARRFDPRSRRPSTGSTAGSGTPRASTRSTA